MQHARLYQSIIAAVQYTCSTRLDWRLHSIGDASASIATDNLICFRYDIWNQFVLYLEYINGENHTTTSRGVLRLYDRANTSIVLTLSGISASANSYEGEEQTIDSIAPPRSPVAAFMLTPPFPIQMPGREQPQFQESYRSQPIFRTHSEWMLGE